MESSPTGSDIHSRNFQQNGMKGNSFSPDESCNLLEKNIPFTSDHKYNAFPVYSDQNVKRKSDKRNFLP